VRWRRRPAAPVVSGEASPAVAEEEEEEEEEAAAAAGPGSPLSS
jgi:hypothetical protein